MVNSKITPSKAHVVGKESHPDPNVTPWDEELENPAPAKRDRGRTLRDWIVIFVAALLVFYILTFLFVGTSSPQTGGGNFFFSGGSIAVIPIQGEIGSETTATTWGSADIVRAIQDASDDPGVSALFVDIDSGGGSVVASKQIVAALRDVNKPTLAYIGEIGASGAYYVASATDYIVADSDSITGSIGVISVLPNVVGLMDKLGIDVNTIKTGELKDVGSPYNEFTDHEKQVFQDLVNQAFDHFTSDVIAFRGEKLDRVAFDAILDGRIISGSRAKAIGLIDETGTRVQAIKKAAELGGIPGKPALETPLVHTFSLWDILFSMGAQIGSGIQAGLTKGAAAPNGIQAA